MFFLQLNESAVRPPFDAKRIMLGQLHPLHLLDPVIIIDTEDYDRRVWPL